MITKKS